MVFGSRSRGYGGRGGFRTPRGGGSHTSSFRGRGRGSGIGSDSYYGSSSRDSYYDKSHSHHTPSYKENNFRLTRAGDDSYGLHSLLSSASRYADRFTSTRGSGKYSSDQNSYLRHSRESASGSLARDYSRRNLENEPERKRFRTDLSGSYREGGPSPRKSYDTYEHTPRNSGFNSSNNSATRLDSSSYGVKPLIPSSSAHRKEYLSFKKPLPPARGGRTEASSTLVKRGTRGRVFGTAAPIRRTKPTTSIALKRAAALNNVARSKAAARLQQTLRRKKQLRIMRMRKERLERLEVGDSSRKNDENESSSEEKTSEVADKTTENREYSAVDKVAGKSDEKTNGHEAEGTKLKGSSPETSTSQSKNIESPVRGLFRERIALKCDHCQVECKTFRTYSYHLTTNKHKVAMERLLHSMKQKLRRMRMEQRDQQRIIDEQNDNYARTSYCKLCKLNYKQSRQEHYTSDFHINMNEFLNSRCSICRVSFGTPILYEHHLCTLTHIKRMAAHGKKGIGQKHANDDDNEEDGFMVLDSVGSADESNDEEAGDISTETNEEGETKTRSSSEGKKKAQKIIGGEFIKQVQVHYCLLCKMCLHYNAHRDEDDYVAKHSRTRFHLKRYMLEKAKKTASTTDEQESTNELRVKIEPDADENESWLDADIGEPIKDEDEDSLPDNRYDRFKNSDGVEVSGTLVDNDSNVKATTVETNPPKNNENEQV